MTEVNVLEDLKIILGIDGFEEDKLLKISVEYAADYIRSYCNFLPGEALPKMLLTVLYDLAASKYTSYKNIQTGQILEAKTVSDNGQSVSFGRKEEANLEAAAIMNKYEELLNRYRRIL